MKRHFVGVIGAGRSGLAVARLLHRQGDRVLLSDVRPISQSLRRGIEIEEGHSDRLLETDFLIRSPGVSGHLPILKAAERKHIPIYSEIEYADRFIQPLRRVAITGTNGKTTTTTLVGELFKSIGPTVVAGNIGKPLADLISKITPLSTVVLEVSSYQLENMERFHPTLSAILNVTPDHLEHHGTMRAYAAAKARVFENQTSRDICVMNADDAWCRRLARRCHAQLVYFSRTRALPKGIWYDAGSIVIRWRKWNERFPLQWALPGPHNIENALAAIALALLGGVPLQNIKRVLSTFKGVQHRLESVRTLNGVRYINDSKATNVDSTRVALASFTQPLWVIMGGRGKGSPYTPLTPLIKKHVRGLLLIGEEAPKIAKDLKASARSWVCGTMTKAVSRARTLAKPGDVVLLSPACASFDQYVDYEARGRDFKTCVKHLS